MEGDEWGEVNMGGGEYRGGEYRGGEYRKVNMEGNEIKYGFTYFNMLIICMLLQIINKVKVTHQGQGHINVKVKISIFSQFYVKFTYFHIFNPLYVSIVH